MSTTPTPTPIALDDAITAVKTAEGAFTNAQQADAGSDAQVAAAAQAKASTSSQLTSAASAYKGALDVLKASIDQVEGGLPAPAPAA